MPDWSSTLNTHHKARLMRLWSMLLAFVSTFAMEAPSTGAEPGLSYVCSGNEPFWRIEITGTEAVLSKPGGDGVEQEVFAGRLDAFAYLDPPWVLWRGKRPNPDGDLVVVARAERCLDTMADEGAFDYRALVSFPEGNAATGCCNAIAALTPAGAPAGSAKAGAAHDVAPLWPDLDPAIKACLAAVPVDVRSVVKAWPMNHGRIGVRLVGSEGDRFDCIVVNGPNTVERIDPVAAAAPPSPGERGPIFLPSAGDPPKVSCGYLGRVVDYRGATAGYLHYRDGCSRQ